MYICMAIDHSRLSHTQAPIGCLSLSLALFFYLLLLIHLNEWVCIIKKRADLTLAIVRQQQPSSSATDRAAAGRRRVAGGSAPHSNHNGWRRMWHLQHCRWLDTNNCGNHILCSICICSRSRSRICIYIWLACGTHHSICMAGEYTHMYIYAYCICRGAYININICIYLLINLQVQYYLEICAT